jgi:pimeloyl-ACP methyl ester carboxylesterase
LFNYRGVNQSKWLPILGHAWLGELVGRYMTLERDGCVCDCETMIQYVRHGLGVKSHRILLLGHSIGAAFSAQAAALAHPAVSVCNSRSFSTLSSVVQALAPVFFGLDDGRSAASGLLRRLGKLLVVATGWELDSAAAWHHLTGAFLRARRGDGRARARRPSCMPCARMRVRVHAACRVLAACIAAF